MNASGDERRKKKERKKCEIKKLRFCMIFFGENTHRER